MRFRAVPMLVMRGILALAAIAAGVAWAASYQYHARLLCEYVIITVDRGEVGVATSPVGKLELRITKHDATFGELWSWWHATVPLWSGVPYWIFALLLLTYVPNWLPARRCRHCGARGIEPPPAKCPKCGQQRPLPSARGGGWSFIASLRYPAKWCCLALTLA